MLKLLAKLLSVNPVLSLLIVLLYVATLWYVTHALWRDGHEVLSIVFIVGVSLWAKWRSPALILELKRIKQERGKDAS